MAAEQQQQQGDHSLAALWIAVGLFLLVGVIWWSAKTYIVAFVFGLRFYEVKLISFFVPGAVQIANFIQSIPPSQYGDVTFNVLATVSTQVGDYLRYPVAVVLGGLAILLYMGDTTLRYKRIYTMDALKNEEAENWPQIIPVCDIDLAKQDIKEGPWAMSMTPMQFAKKHKLLREKALEADETTLIHRALPKVTILKGMLRKVLAMQLGPFWTGVEHLNPHTKAIFAILVARANRDAKAAETLSADIARSTRGNTLDFSGVDAVIKKYKDSPVVKRNRTAFPHITIRRRRR